MKLILSVFILTVTMTTAMIIAAKEITELRQRVYSLEYRFDREIKK